MFLLEHNPLEQFTVVGLNTLPHLIPNVYIMSNFNLTFLVIGFLLIIIFYSAIKSTLVFNQWFNLVLVNIFGFIKNILFENFQIKKLFFIIYIFTLFAFILLFNLIGMIPFSFAVTSHFTVTFFLSFITFFTCCFLGLKTHGISFFSLFLPNGAPFLLSPFLILIELISFSARLFSLAIRLFANIMSGHTLLKILTSFIWIIFLSKSILFIIPFALVGLINLLEIMIGMLQAYVFTTLACIYLNEALVLH